RFMQGPSLGGTALVGIHSALLKISDPFQIMRAIALELVGPGRHSGFHRGQLATPQKPIASQEMQA
ncbi:hypothetical protein ABTL36_19325, partial [Acinetobacter baumannii]